MRSLEAAIAKQQAVGSKFYPDLADAYRHAGRLERAVALYREACSRDPGGWPAFFGLGLALSAKGDREPSAAALRRALALAPWQTEVVKSLAGALASGGKSQDAIAMLRAAPAADPDSSDLHSNLSAAMMRA